jgi:hypothetical protein
MVLDAFIHRFRLATGSGAQGLRCGADGLSLAGVSLLRKSTEGFAARAPEEVGALMLAAYGDVFDRDRLARGLRATASALNRGDVDLAMIAAVHLRLPDLDAEAASRIAAVDDFLAKYDPDEPRDWRGRWTTGGEGAPRPAAQPPRGAGARADSETRSANKPESNWDGVSHPTGGHLIPTGGGSGEDFGDNEPPPWEGRVEPDSPPAINAPKVPRGWDRVEDGALVRRPMLRNGQPWPEASVDSVLETLRRERGAPPPRMWILVPLDSKGPPLVGSTGADEFLERRAHRHATGDLEAGHTIQSCARQRGSGSSLRDEQQLLSHLLQFGSLYEYRGRGGRTAPPGYARGCPAGAGPRISLQALRELLSAASLGGQGVLAPTHPPRDG